MVASVSKNKNIFIKNFLADYKVAAFSSSSNFLIKKVSKEIAGNLNLIIEQGAGDGIMTVELLKKLAPDGRLILIEQNKDFIKLLKNIKDKRITIFEGFVQDFNYDDYLKGGKKADLIISSIPFTFLSKTERASVCQKAHDRLAPKGQFIIFHQYSKIMAEVVEKYFKNISTKFVLRNVLPCFIITGVK